MSKKDVQYYKENPVAWVQDFFPLELTKVQKEFMKRIRDERIDDEVLSVFKQSKLNGLHHSGEMLCIVDEASF